MLYVQVLTFVISINRRQIHQNWMNLASLVFTRAWRRWFNTKDFCVNLLCYLWSASTPFPIKVILRFYLIKTFGWPCMGLMEIIQYLVNWINEIMFFLISLSYSLSLPTSSLSCLVFRAFSGAGFNFYFYAGQIAALKFANFCLIHLRKFKFHSQVGSDNKLCQIFIFKTFIWFYTMICFEHALKSVFSP